MSELLDSALRREAHEAGSRWFYDLSDDDLRKLEAEARVELDKAEARYNAMDMVVARIDDELEERGLQTVLEESPPNGTD